MRPAAAALGLALIAVALLLAGGEPARADCVPVLVWRATGYDYVPMRRGVRVQPGSRFGTGIVPPCLDTLPAPDPPPRGRHVRLRRIPGVRPRIAFYAEHSVWSAPGFFPVLPSHPLHRLIYGDEPGVPNSTRGARCGNLSWLRGRVDSAGPANLALRGRPAPRFIDVDAYTGISGFSRLGEKYLRAGDRVRVLAWHCRHPDYGRYLVARRVRPR